MAKTSSPHGSPAPHVIRAARKAVRMTQADAAEVVSVSTTTWCRWESGTCPMPPGLFDLFQIATKADSLDPDRIDRATALDLNRRLDALVRDAMACRRQVARHLEEQ